MPNDSFEQLDRILNGCECCAELDHEVSDCPDLAAWRKREALQEMAAEAAYYQVPDWKERLGK